MFDNEDVRGVLGLKGRLERDKFCKDKWSKITISRKSSAQKNLEFGNTREVIKPESKSLVMKQGSYIEVGFVITGGATGV
jgi:hypothetical protein